MVVSTTHSALEMRRLRISRICIGVSLPTQATLPTKRLDRREITTSRSNPGPACDFPPHFLDKLITHRYFAMQS